MPLPPPDIVFIGLSALQWEVKGDRHVSEFNSDHHAALGLPDLNTHRQSFLKPDVSASGLFHLVLVIW
jgi:hypothetical protein